MKCKYIEGKLPLIDKKCHFYHWNGFPDQYKKKVCEANADACTIRNYAVIIESDRLLLEKIDRQNLEKGCSIIIGPEMFDLPVFKENVENV